MLKMLKKDSMLLNRVNMMPWQSTPARKQLCTWNKKVLTV